MSTKNDVDKYLNSYFVNGNITSPSKIAVAIPKISARKRKPLPQGTAEESPDEEVTKKLKTKETQSETIDLVPEEIVNNLGSPVTVSIEEKETSLKAPLPLDSPPVVFNHLSSNQGNSLLEVLKKISEQQLKDQELHTSNYLKLFGLVQKISDTLDSTESDKYSKLIKSSDLWDSLQKNKIPDRLLLTNFIIKELAKNFIKFDSLSIILKNKIVENMIGKISNKKKNYFQFLKKQVDSHFLNLPDNHNNFPKKMVYQIVMASIEEITEKNIISSSQIEWNFHKKCPLALSFAISNSLDKIVKEIPKSYLSTSPNFSANINTIKSISVLIAQYIDNLDEPQEAQHPLEAQPHQEEEDSDTDL